MIQPAKYSHLFSLVSISSHEHSSWIKNTTTQLQHQKLRYCWWKITYAREDQRSQEAHRLEFPLDSSIITIIGASTMEFLSSGKCSRELPSILPLKKSFLRLLLLRHTSAVASLNLRSENQINVLFLRRTLSFGNGRIFETNISLNGQAKACLVEVITRYVYNKFYIFVYTNKRFYILVCSFLLHRWFARYIVYFQSSTTQIFMDLLSIILLKCGIT